MGLEVLVIKFEAKDQGVVFRELRRWVEDGGVRGFTYVRVGECVVVGGDEFDSEDAVGWGGEGGKGRDLRVWLFAMRKGCDGRGIVGGNV